ncbi:hypothetical protein COLO4_00134 [Corchorus olitorius]|uniref:Uncharacterized protein n=1 Tax=Corchorus olitorius TaxID=93759 RepID=A0A1R3L4J9_9ROSI|nr:hypothetical protein COLO4_00134 [Corchorus olitorius]
MSQAVDHELFNHITLQMKLALSPRFIMSHTLL